ncbi:spore germination protein [Ectobacillus sp. sgz5001026]|uniref:spore germination protein n=1 Tax=Ectobacillus sp. sgz5001026 TaxID=3242473 RepID=UPI0036D2F86D
MKLHNSRRGRQKNSSESNTSLASSLLQKQIHTNLEMLQTIMGKSTDIITRKIMMKEEEIFAAVVHISGISDEEQIDRAIIAPLLSAQIDCKDIQEAVFQVKQAISVSNITIGENWKDVSNAILSGSAAIFIDGWEQAFLANTTKMQSRSLTESTTQTVIRGPKDSFTENFGTNVALVRSKLQSQNLRLETMKIGKETQTNVGMMYIKGIANNEMVGDVKKNLQRIDIDGVLESAYVETYLRDDTISLFPTLVNTERPDVVIGNLLEGRIAIFVHGTPYVLIGPATFIQFFQISEDYYGNQYISSFIRLLRFISFFISMFVPAIYIALISHHQGLIPTQLLISMAVQREGVPFPQIVELFGMEIIFEILHEAGIRMPRAIGQAFSIVGALIIGQAAVQAGIVSATVVIIVSITALSTFVIPNYNMSIASRMLRFIFILLAAFLGLYGITLGFLIVVLHMCGLRSFGVPYMAPISPLRIDELKDTFIRFPLPSLLKKRPSPASSQNKTREEIHNNHEGSNEK